MAPSDCTAQREKTQIGAGRCQVSAKTADYSGNENALGHVAPLIIETPTLVMQVAAFSMLRALFIVSFLVLALIAPVWIPVAAVKALTPRPAASRLDEDD
jgi:hypothetical protein